MLRKKGMRVGLISLLVFSIFLGGLGPKEAEAKMTVEKIKAYYMVMDADTGEVLASRKSKKKILPASTTKVLTVITAIDQMVLKGIDMEDYVKVTKKMIKSVPYGSKCAYLHAKSRYKMKDIIGLVMVASAADAVKVLEKRLFKTEKIMARKMNAKARAIGMKKSNFNNGIGLDKSSGYKGIYTTAEDMAKLAFYANEKYPEVGKYSKKKKIRVHDKKAKYYHVLRSTNQFYTYAAYSKKKYKITGMKTGFTTPAGSTLLTKAEGKTEEYRNKKEDA